MSYLFDNSAFYGATLAAGAYEAGDPGPWWLAAWQYIPAANYGVDTNCTVAVADATSGNDYFTTYTLSSVNAIMRDSGSSEFPGPNKPSTNTDSDAWVFVCVVERQVSREAWAFTEGSSTFHTRSTPDTTNRSPGPWRRAAVGVIPQLTISFGRCSCYIAEAIIGQGDILEAEVRELASGKSVEHLDRYERRVTGRYRMDEDTGLVIPNSAPAQSALWGDLDNVYVHSSGVDPVYDASHPSLEYRPTRKIVKVR